MNAAAGDRDERIKALFADELTDRTRILEEGLLTLEKAPATQRGAILEELARAAHTLKGSAAMMDAPQVARICHELEDTLARIRPSEDIDDERIEELLSDVDRIRVTGRAELGLETPSGTPPLPSVGATIEIAERATVPSARPLPSDAALGSVRLPSHKLNALVGRTADLRATTSSMLGVPQRLAEIHDVLRQRSRRPDRAETDGDAWREAATMVADLDRRVRPLFRGFDRVVGGIESTVRDVVTVPLEQACTGLARSVRDIAHRQDKAVQLHLDVGDVEIDRRALAVVADALLHLGRNAVDHGIEAPKARLDAGKPEVGTVTVAATMHGDHIAVTVTDDGQGVDWEAVRAAAEQSGLAGDTDPHELIFAPGLSTATVTTDISGRGVGMDAVRDRVEAIGGTVAFRSDADTGTEVTLTVPTSVTTAQVLMVESSGERIAVLVTAIERVIRVKPRDVVHSEGRSWLRREDDMLPLFPLAELAGLGDPADTPTDDRPRPALVVSQTSQQRTALLVDRVTGHHDVVVQPLGSVVPDLAGVVGAGVLEGGQVAIVLHPSALVRASQHRTTRQIRPTADTAEQQTPRVLLVEDAPTTRALEQGLLEAAGYEVIPAVDGRDAWSMLRRETVDVVVSDVDMPGMNGIQLCERIRSSPSLRELPIILVTSRESDEDRRRGADAGADAYLVKSSFAQGDLLAAIARMLP